MYSLSVLATINNIMSGAAVGLPAMWWLPMEPTDKL